jgi:hypothetical protein
MPSHAATGDASLSHDATFPGASPLSHAASGDASLSHDATFPGASPLSHAASGYASPSHDATFPGASPLSHAALGDASPLHDATFPGASPLSHAASGDASSNEGLTHSLPHHLFNSGQTFILDDLTTVHTDDTSSNVSNQFLRSELNSISFNFISLFFIFFRETKSIVY